MTEITQRGNLPKHLQVMAKEVDGQRSTRFYEMTGPDELLNHAKDGNCEETTVTLDASTARGFMVAFSFNDSSIENLEGDKLVVMNVFFTELDSEQARYYRKMLHEHRNQQEDAHTRWKNKQQGQGATDDQ